MSIAVTGKKILDFLQKVGSDWKSIVIKQNLPQEIPFYLQNKTYATATEEERAGKYGYWDNQNIKAEATGENLDASSTLRVSDASKFKYVVNNIEGSYTFTYGIPAGSAQYGVWMCEDIEGEIMPADLEPIYGISGVVTPPSFPLDKIPTFTVVLTYDGYKEQKIMIPAVTSEMVGSVGVIQSATKQEYDAAAYAQLRCIHQEGVDGKNDGHIIIVCYGVIPDIDIPCVISPAFEFERNTIVQDDNV